MCRDAGKASARPFRRDEILTPGHRVSCGACPCEDLSVRVTGQADQFALAELPESLLLMPVPGSLVLWFPGSLVPLWIITGILDASGFTRGDLYWVLCKTCLGLPLVSYFVLDYFLSLLMYVCVSLSLCICVSLSVSVSLSLSLSPCLPVSLSPCLSVSPYLSDSLSLSLSLCLSPCLCLPVFCLPASLSPCLSRSLYFSLCLSMSLSTSPLFV